MAELTSLPPSPLPSGGTSERSCSTQYVFLNYQRRGCRRVHFESDIVGGAGV